MSQPLYQKFDSASEMGFLNSYKNLPQEISGNLNPAFKIRDYQQEAFGRFIYYLESYPEKQIPTHLLFNMATGSGKTLIMAGLILYLYKQGYRNFLFFVNSTNIVSKTKENFINTLSSKYLFNQKIIFESKEVQIKEVNNFDESDPDNINICLTTIQQLHDNLNKEKENSITIDDLKQNKIVLLSDEAHHSNSSTKKKNNSEELFEEKGSWENTVDKVFTANSENILLEFTATLDFLDENIVEKYQNKIIYRYDLKSFRQDKFSKDVSILQSDSDEKTRILQTIILNQYRQDIGAKHKINIKPVILFKAQKTIDESNKNKELFEDIIENLETKQILDLKRKTNIDLIQRAIDFYDDKEALVDKLKFNFGPEHIITTNEKKTDETKYKNEDQIQRYLNTLENLDNPIRAVFTVNKLNEGWDVLNLFDIVRLYNTRDGKTNKQGKYNPGKTTLSEAQLIGRGARYYPFKTSSDQEKFQRKYDSELENELRILEEIHYHSHNEPRYISEIRSALIDQGLLDEKDSKRHLKLKDNFKNTNFYKNGLMFVNLQEKRINENTFNFKELSWKQTTFGFNINSNAGKSSLAFLDTKESNNSKEVSKEPRDIKISELNKNIILKAINRDGFYKFKNLKKYLPELKSINEFIFENKYLGDINIRFTVNSDTEIDTESKLESLLELFTQIKLEIQGKASIYKGSDKFEPKRIKNIFTDKIIKRDLGISGDEDYLSDKDWYVYESNFGTSEEKEMVRTIESQIKKLQTEYKDVYLIRNERHFRIFRFSDGKPFEPDFVLFARTKESGDIIYQIFLEPKGDQFRSNTGFFEAGKESDKLDFLKELYDRYKDQIIDLGITPKYKIIGLPVFYNKNDEVEFIDTLSKSLKINQN